MRSPGTATTACAAAAALILCAARSPAVARERAAEPGKSLRGIALNASRAQALAAVQRRFKNAKRPAPRTYTYAGGYVEDQWDISSGRGGAAVETFVETFAVLSRHGRVVQLRVYTSKPEGSPPQCDSSATAV